MTNRKEKVDHDVFPEVIHRDSGEVLSRVDVEYAYTREGRREIGMEFPNPVPLAAPFGFSEQPPIWEQIRAMVKRELSAGAEEAGYETEEEANDFDVGDDFDPFSPWEEVFEPTKPWPAPPEVAEAEKKVVDTKSAPASESAPVSSPDGPKA